jgi:hypothetical protein
VCFGDLAMDLLKCVAYAISIGLAIGFVAGFITLTALRFIEKSLMSRSLSFPKGAVTALFSLLTFMTGAEAARLHFYPIDDPFCAGAYFLTVASLIGIIARAAGCRIITFAGSAAGSARRIRGRRR